MQSTRPFRSTCRKASVLDLCAGSLGAGDDGGRPDKIDPLWHY